MLQSEFNALGELHLNGTLGENHQILLILSYRASIVNAKHLSPNDYMRSNDTETSCTVLTMNDECESTRETYLGMTHYYVTLEVARHQEDRDSS